MIKEMPKKIILLLLVISFVCNGCFFNKKEEKEEEQKEEVKEIIIDDLTYNNLGDEKFHEYLIETLYANLEGNFDNEDYTVEQISTVYLSKEYLEEISYNSKSNIYFGFTQEELDKIFSGKKYEFTVGADNQTIVEEFKIAEDNYYKMIKNVLIGTGVILVFVTVSTVTGGTIGELFAFGALTGTTFALTGGSSSFIISTLINYYKSGDIKAALEKGKLDASESFKWGAIIGSITGTAQATINYFKNAKYLKSLNFQERGSLSEARVLKKYSNGKGQVSYLNGKEVPLSTAGATRPDISVPLSNGGVEAIEVKNTELLCKSCKEGIIRELRREIADRLSNLPSGSTQKIVFDTYGRFYSKSTLEAYKLSIQSALSDIYPNIPVEFVF